MILTVEERVRLLSALPTEGDYSTLKILHDLRMALAFTEEELKEWKIINNPENGTIRGEMAGEAEIPIGEKSTGVIIDTLRGLEKRKKLEYGLLSVYEKFIPTTE